MTDTIVLRGGRIGLGGPPADIVVRQGLIAAIGRVGTADEAAAELLTLTDATVLPGLVDGHVHTDQWAHSSRRIDVSAARSPEELTHLIRAAIESDPSRATSAHVITAHGYTDGLWEQPAHRDILDRVLGEISVAAVSKDMHAVWLNSAALTTLGRSDHPTGVLREQDAVETMQRLMHTVPDHTVDRWVAETMEAAARRGVTAIVDFSYADNLTDWQRRYATLSIPMRVHASVWLPWLQDAINAGRRTGDVIAETHQLLSVGPFKLMADGSLNTRTAHCHDPYPNTNGQPDAYGLELIPPAKLTELMTYAWKAGLEPAVHAIGDHANSSALDAFQRIGCPGRIEHAQLIRPEDFHRFNLPGLVASVQPQHAVLDRDVADYQWRGRTAQAFAYHALHEAGARLELGSDAPVSPLDPWLAIADAVERTDDERPPWHPEQALPLEVAITAACGGRQNIEVGDRADLSIVPGDPLASQPTDLRQMPVLATLVHGRFVHRTQ